MRHKLSYILMFIIMSMSVFGIQIYSDNFNGTTINSTFWTNSGCTQASNMLTCAGDNTFVYSVNLSKAPIPFSPHNFYNVSYILYPGVTGYGAGVMTSTVPQLSAASSLYSPRGLSTTGVSRQGIYISSSIYIPLDNTKYATSGNSVEKQSDVCRWNGLGTCDGVGASYASNFSFVTTKYNLSNAASIIWRYACVNHAGAMSVDCTNSSGITSSLGSMNCDSNYHYVTLPSSCYNSGESYTNITITDSGPATGDFVGERIITYTQYSEMNLIYNSSGYHVLRNGVSIASNTTMTGDLMYFGFGDWETDYTGTTQSMSSFKITQNEIGFKFYANDYLGVPINNFTIYLTNSSGTTSKNTLNGSMILNAIGNYTVNITSPNMYDQQVGVEMPLNGFKTFVLNYAVVDMQDCSDVDSTYHETANFSIYNEQDISKNLTGDITVDLEVYGRSLNVSFINKNVSSVALCLPLGLNLTHVYGTVTAKVATESRYFFVDTTFNNDVKYIKLYSFNTTTGVSVLQSNVYDESFVEYPGLIEKLERYYPELHSWINVQQDISDSFGQTVNYIVEQTVSYRLNYYTNNSLLYTSGSFKLVCEANLCYRRFNIPSTVLDSDLVITHSFTNSSKIINVTWNDFSYKTTYIRFVVERVNGPSVVSICNEYISASSGNTYCNVTSQVGTIVYKVYSSDSPNIPKVFVTIVIPRAPLTDVIDDQEAAFWTFGILLVFAGIGAVSPAAMVIMVVFGIWIVIQFNISPITNTLLLILAGVIGFFASKVVSR